MTRPERADPGFTALFRYRKAVGVRDADPGIAYRRTRIQDPRCRHRPVPARPVVLPIPIGWVSVGLWRRQITNGQLPDPFTLPTSEESDAP
jgi:hypothetical protein